MRAHPGNSLFACALALLTPTAVVAQMINGDDIFLTDASPEIAFSDTDGIVGFNWSIRGYDEYFRIVDTAANVVYLNINPALSGIALGRDAASVGIESAALGYGANSGGDYSTALGYSSDSAGISSTALGVLTSSTGSNSTALGSVASSAGDYSTAVGFSASSSGNFSAALGYEATSNGLSSIALGREASSVGNSNVAVGHLASSLGTNGTALGYATISYGNYSTALGGSAESAGLSSTAVGNSANSLGPSSTALGHLASSGGISSTALGNNASSNGNFSTALGRSASSGGPGSTALGHLASAVGYYSTALGLQASSPSDSSIAMGYQASSVGNGSTALGRSATTAHSRSTALGYRAYADQSDAVILGSIAGVNGATAYANVGIGTSAPSEAVDVQRSAAAARFQLSSFTDTANEAPQFIQRRARGTSAAPVAVQNGDNLGLFSFRGYNGTSMGGSRATITAQAAGTFTGASNPTRLIFSTTPVGSTTPQSVLVITPDGKVQVNGQNLTVPDYVFGDDYALMPLDELQAFIDEHGHLPGIASADEVNAGVHDLAGSDMAHLQKIEELTLYTLQLQDQVRQQQARIVELETLQDRVAQLEMSAQTRALADHD